MSKIAKFWSLAILSLSMLSFTGITSSDWKFEKEKNDIKVYTKKKGDSNLKAFKAVTQVDGSVQSVFNKIIDFDTYTSWVNDCKEAYTVENNTDDYVYYIKFDTPWPVSNRDVVIKFMVKDQSQNRIYAELVDDHSNKVDKKSKVVRMTDFSATWLLEQTGSKVSITHTGYGDPGGSVPTWLINSTVTDGPINSLSNLKKLLE